MASPAEIELLLNSPALAAPPGTSNPYQFNNPPNLNTICFTVMGVCVFVACLAVIMRMYTKLFVIGKVQLEDYILLLGFAGFLAFDAVALKCTLNGAGTHQWDLQVKDLSGILFYYYIALMIYGDIITILKISIILQCLRVFAPVRKMNLIYVGFWGILWTLVIFFASITITVTFICSPREKFWNVLITTGRCLNVDTIFIATGTVTTLSDILILILPQPTIWKLQMTQKRKYAISGVFLTGSLACVASVFRLAYSIKLSKTSDQTYYMIFVGIWAVVEMAIGILCCCLPILPKFCQSVGPKLSALSKSSSVSTLWIPFKTSVARSKSDAAFTNPYHPQIKLNTLYETLGDHEPHTLVTHTRNTSNSIDDISKPIAKPGIRVARTYEIDSCSAAESVLDLEKQNKVIPKHTGW